MVATPNISDLLQNALFAQWFEKLTELGKKKGISVDGEHATVLDLFFRQNKSATDALAEYLQFIKRWRALKGNETRQALTDKDPMPFGKHKGKALVNVPAHYLLWVWKDIYKEFCNELSDDLCKYIHANLNVLRIEAAKNNKFLSR